MTLKIRILLMNFLKLCIDVILTLYEHFKITLSICSFPPEKEHSNFLVGDINITKLIRLRRFLGLLG
jgi:hypothetical protein